jgi:CheY-specific phosphatase CheX
MSWARQGQKRRATTVGEADSMDTALDVYEKEKPDLVMMDIAMPENDGFAVSRALLRLDCQARIILSSSMKDTETEAEAKHLGILGYVQKPIDADVLFDVIHKVLSPDTLFQKLLDMGLDIFQEALSQNITRITKTPVAFTKGTNLDEPYISKGITAVIGIIGQYTGTMILDISTETAHKLSKEILHREVRDHEEVLAMISELANVVGGGACSMLNKQDKSYHFKVSPPSLFHGNAAELMSPMLQLQKTMAQTPYGEIFLGVGFKKGSTLWM